MSLNPLNKLRRFSSVPTVAAEPEKPKEPEYVPSLTPEERKKLANKDSHFCKHCKCPATDKNFIMFCKGPLTGWYCFECWTHHYQHKELPVPKIPRVVPKMVKP